MKLPISRKGIQIRIYDIFCLSWALSFLLKGAPCKNGCFFCSTKYLLWGAQSVQNDISEMKVLLFMIQRERIVVREILSPMTGHCDDFRLLVKNDIWSEKNDIQLF